MSSAASNTPIVASGLGSGAPHQQVTAGLMSPVDALMGGTLSPAMSQPRAALGAIAEEGGFKTSSGASGSVSVPLAAAPLSTPDVQQCQGFRIGNIGLMIGYHEASELVELPPSHSLPNSPVWFVGMTNLHGLTVPVFDLAAFLGFEVDENQGQPMLLVLSSGADATGVVINDMPQRLTWTRKQQVDTTAVPPSLMPFVRNACMIDNAMWFELDVGGIQTALENGIRSS